MKPSTKVPVTKQTQKAKAPAKQTRAKQAKAPARPKRSAKLADVTLRDRFDLSKSHVLLTGVQALVRLTMMQKERDRAAGLDTAGYVTGYRGSPLGGVDHQFARSQSMLEPLDIKFLPGLNEDLAATALWGTQQAEIRGEGKYDGVFGIWYGKGPGVDRCGDVFRHANHAGTSKHGGVLALMGDDHMAESSTVAHQSEFVLMDVMMPVLNPAGVQELIDYGLYGWALSRYSGCWVGLKCVKDTVESTAVVEAGATRAPIRLPDDFEMPRGGVNIRPFDERLEQEERLHHYKRFAATAFARANKLDRMIFKGGKAPKIGIATTGKSYLDVRQALADLGIDEKAASRLGIRLYKVAMTWPLEPHGIEDFAAGLDKIIVIEEKRSLIETQIREQLYGRAKAPEIIGKRDEAGDVLFPAFGALSPNEIAMAIAERVLARAKDEAVARNLKTIKTAEAAISDAPEAGKRTPYFCAGCPHNTSTVVPDGARAYAGIGCHWMAQGMDRNTEGCTHMGGEGANWIGEAPFSKRSHVFQNLGDGTYNHSGILALRAAIASGVNITYKILYNDAVAMTGGQAHEGNLSVEMIAAQVAAEGVNKLVIVSDEPEKYGNTKFPDGATIHHRDELAFIQDGLEKVEGVSVLIYDQTCAAEKRRRRKRGTYPDPAKRVFINELVCEGCGDCGVQSNCVAIVPVETEFGRKRQIDQSMCNKDYSCLKGFCPSFVTVEGGQLRTGKPAKPVADTAQVFEVLPEPDLPALDAPYAVLVTGIGGTGVVTIAALLGMAARLEGKGAAIIDMAGLAQKNGAVTSHLKIAARPEDIQSIRVAAGGADLVLGCDLMVTGSRGVLNAMKKGRTHVVVNTHETMPASFTHEADLLFPGAKLARDISGRVGKGLVNDFDAGAMVETLLGDTMGTNLFVLGFAWQKGLVPLSQDAISRAIELNGVQVDMNKQAFLWGRRAAHDLKRVEKLATPKTQGAKPARTLDEMVETRSEFLTQYQNAAYAGRYRALVDKVARAEAALPGNGNDLAKAVARYYFKLLAYKDEYEVARLHSDGSFADAIASRFEGDYALKFHLAPPLFAARDKLTGRPRKSRYGPWMMGAFRLLARFKGLRGTPFDVFGYAKERRLERRLIAEYEADIEGILSRLTAANRKQAAGLAGWPEQVRGYGHVKARHMAEAAEQKKALNAAFRSAGSVRAKAA